MDKIVLNITLTIGMIFFVVNSSSQNTFIQNKGQFPDKVIAKLNIPSGSLFIEPDALVYNFYSSKQLKELHDQVTFKKNISAHSYRVSFLNSNKELISQLKGESKYYENYYIGKKDKWAREVRSFKSLELKNVYEGIDINYYIQKNKLKYDFIVKPLAKTNKIKIKYIGASSTKLLDGNLHINTSVNKIIEYAPYAYQIIDEKKIEIACKFILKNNIIEFDFPDGYDDSYILIIDPTLDFSTYSGSTSDNFGYTATYDDKGFLYSGSTTFGSGYPTTFGAYQTSYANSSGGTDITITKYDTTGNQRIYSTYLGGELDELPHSMIVNSNNELFIYGTTGSTDFPVTSEAYQQVFNGGPSLSPGIGVYFPNGTDIFISRISVNGGYLLSSTFLGGTGNDGLNTSNRLKYNYADEVRGEIDIDNNNNIYVVSSTKSTDFPTINSFQSSLKGQQDGCIIKMDNNLTSVVWSSYIGGASDDAIYSLALDKNNDIYVTGGTTSADFLTSFNAFQNNHNDTTKADAFISKISANGNQISYSTFFGTKQYDQSYFVEIGSNDQIYLFGQTEAEGDQLVHNATYFNSDAGQFIAVLSSDLSKLVRSTVFGSGKGSPDISPTAFLVDLCNKIYIAGWGSSISGSLSTLNLQISQTSFQQNTDGNDMYLMVLDEFLSTRVYSTFFGGSQSSEHVDGGTSRFDKRGIIYQSVCAGCGGYSDFPIEPDPGAVSTTNTSTNCNNAVFKFNFDFPIVISEFKTPEVTCDLNVKFENLTSSPNTTVFSWDFGDGNTSTDINPTHQYSVGGLYYVTLISTDIGTCNISDTTTKQLYILSNSSDTLLDVLKCPSDNLQIGISPVSNLGINYTWYPSTNLSSPNIPNPYTNVTSSQEYQLLITDGFCTDTIFQKVEVVNLYLDAGKDTLFCRDSIYLEASYSNKVNRIEWSFTNDFIEVISDSAEVLVGRSQMFYVRASNDICIETDSIFVDSDSILIAFVSNDICEGDSIRIEAINLNTSSLITKYNWQGFESNLNSITDYPDSSRWYFVQVTNENNCIAEDSIFINVFANPQIDSLWVNENNFYQGQSIFINYMYGEINDSVPVTLDQSGWNIIKINNQHNCFARDSIWLELFEINCSASNFVIPNAFTPFNSEGTNDQYFIKEIQEGLVEKFNLEIFNRYGQLIFSSRDIKEVWDGSYNNEALPPQIFDFYINITCIGGMEFLYKGNITLLR